MLLVFFVTSDSYQAWFRYLKYSLFWVGHQTSHITCPSFVEPEFIKVFFFLDCFYIGLFSAPGQTHVFLSQVILNRWLVFKSAFWISTKVVCLNAVRMLPCETAAISVHSVHTKQPCTILHHFMQSCIHRVHACLAVTCHCTFGRVTRIFYVLLP